MDNKSCAPARRIRPAPDPDCGVSATDGTVMNTHCDGICSLQAFRKSVGDPETALRKGTLFSELISRWKCDPARRCLSGRLYRKGGTHMSGINRNGGRSASGCRSAGEDVPTRDARFPATRMSAAPALSPRTEMQDAPDNPGRPPLRPCPQHNGCGRNPRPEFGNPTATAAAPASESSPAPETGVPDAVAAEITKPPIEELRAVEFALDEVILYRCIPLRSAALDLYRHLLERRCPLVERYRGDRSVDAARQYESHQVGVGQPSVPVGL